MGDCNEKCLGNAMNMTLIDWTKASNSPGTKQGTTWQLHFHILLNVRGILCTCAVGGDRTVPSSTTVPCRGEWHAAVSMSQATSLIMCASVGGVCSGGRYCCLLKAS